VTAAARAAALLFVALAACSPAPAELADSADAALRAGNYGDARSLAERGLDAAGHEADEPTRWTLNRVRLEALAGTGEGAAVEEELDGLAAIFPMRIDSSLWVRLGRAALDGGHLAAAITLIEAGQARYPDEAGKFEQVLLDVQAAAEASHDDESLRRLSQNPYLGRH